MMSLELSNPIRDEQVLFDDRMVLVIKDPYGTAELMTGQESFVICSNGESEIKGVYDAYLQFNPMTQVTPRHLSGRVTYDPGLFPRSIAERLATVYRELTKDESAFNHSQVTSIKCTESGSTGLIISFGETGQTITIYIDAETTQSSTAMIRLNADFGDRNDLDIDLAANAMTAWYLVQKAVANNDDTAHSEPRTFTLESLEYDTLGEFDHISHRYRRFQTVEPARIPRLDVSEQDMMLLIECGLSAEQYHHILEELKTQWEKAYEQGNTVRPIKTHDIAELMTVLGY
jgi:hypothetical protein